VVQKFVIQLEAQLADRGVTFDLQQEAIAWLAEKGYDDRMGARPLGRVIQEHIKKPLADEVLFGRLKKGGTVRVSVAEKPDGSKGLVLDYIADEVVVKPKKEIPVDKKPLAKKKPAPKKPLEKAGADVSASEEIAPPSRKASVPKVPRKK
jgi:ATP-dependent Clp protease ATP-binding subunit ClpA